MRVPQAVHPDVAQPACLAHGSPYLVMEPVGRDMAVSGPGPWDAGLILADGAARGAVAGVGSAAVLAPALRRVVSSEGAVPVSAAVLVRLGHPGWGSAGGAAPGCGLLGWLVGEQEVIVAEFLGGDVNPDLADDLLAELEPPVLLVLRVILDQEPGPVRVLARGELDDGAAAGQDAGFEVQVTDPDLGPLSPAPPAFTVGLAAHRRRASR